MSMTVRRRQSPTEAEHTAPVARRERMERVGSGAGAASLPRRPVPADLADLWTAWLERGCIHASAALVRHYMQSHVRPIAERLRSSLPAHVDIDDLIQQGYLGLRDSMKRFDPEQGVRFETFSSRRISGAMQDWLRSLDHVPRLMRRRSKIVQQQQDRFQAVHGRIPDVDELRHGLDLPADEFDRVIDEARPPMVVTISTTSNGDEDDPVSIPERRPSNPSGSSFRRDLRQWITRDLEPVDTLIVSLYYYESLTMREIGVAVGCSESRVSQRLDSILQRLRARVDLTPELFMRAS